MKKTLILILSLAICASHIAKAEVQFLPEAKENFYKKESSSSLSDNDRCINAGYIYTNCEGPMADECPYKNGYYRTCCPAKYVFNKSECASISGASSCGGYYDCQPTSETAQSLCANLGYDTPASTECPRYVSSTQGCTPKATFCPYSSEYKNCAGEIYCPHRSDPLIL